MIKVLNVRHNVEQPWKLDLEFSDQAHGLFDAQTYLASHHGPLLDALRDPHYLKRAFVDAGALCWPNGLELSPARLRELVQCGVAVRLGLIGKRQTSYLPPVGSISEENEGVEQAGWDDTGKT